MRNRSIILYIFLVVQCLCLYAKENVIDLEEMSQDYVLEVKQLHIQGYPTACNVSIIRWHDSLVLSFNAYSVGKEDQPQDTCKVV
jgi:hypothetical protein